MEKFAGQPLDTLGMSRRVRELLSIHNIGQRLFAKYVLGLSQGTVSELLSKPKCWDKLTEKGRDSYRKMHAWCYDENAVMLLKSLIPRKGELMRQVSQPPPPQCPPGLLQMKGKILFILLNWLIRHSKTKIPGFIHDQFNYLLFVLKNLAALSLLQIRNLKLILSYLCKQKKCRSEGKT